MSKLIERAAADKEYRLLRNALPYLMPDDAALILQTHTCVRCTYNEYVFELGETPPFLYVIETGTVDLWLRTARYGTRVCTLTQGDIFGEGAILKHSAEMLAVAVKPCRLIALRPDTITSACAGTQGFGGRLFRSLASTSTRRRQAS